MAGPAIRAWELARVLARSFEVKLAVPGDPGLEADGFGWLTYGLGGAGRWEAAEDAAQEWADVVIASGHLLQSLPFLRELRVPLVADVYIPGPLEALARQATAEPGLQMKAYERAWQVARLVARYADWLVCASERQRAFWLGVLAACGRLRPELYAADADLRNLVDTVPFGCPKEPPQPAPVLRGAWPGIGREDQVLVWGGGVWNWFDPVTLLRAMPGVLARHPSARLVFLGSDHPHPERVAHMERAEEARALGRGLGLEGRSLFWLGWVPYAERGAYLLEADVGVSLHGSGAEPYFAFRTRLLDLVWAGLPAVVTRGDVLGEELEARGLALGVEPGDVEAVAAAINTLLDEPEARRSRQAGFDDLCKRYRWDRVCEPLQRFCAAPRLDASKQQAAAQSEGGWSSERAALQEQINRLQSVVHGYESGRLMQLMAALRGRRRR